MTKIFRLTMAQLNPTVGDINGNAAQARDAWAQAKAAGADMVALPEMFITGYQAQDLIRRPAFVADAMRALRLLALDCADGPAVAIGGPLSEEDRLYNAYFVLKGGKVHATMRKHFLPNFNVFDEVRLFKSADISGPYTVGDSPRIGSPICEDAWYPDVAEAMVESGLNHIRLLEDNDFFDFKISAKASDVFLAAGGTWKVSFGGTSGWSRRRTRRRSWSICAASTSPSRCTSVTSARP